MAELLNLNESIPEEFYIFVDLNNIITKHNLEITKSLFSSAFGFLDNPDLRKKYLEGTINYLPYSLISNPNYINFMNLYSGKIISKITSEYLPEHNCELYRFNNFPFYPSRLSACYAFGDYETCVRVSKKYGWDINSVKKFKLVPNQLNRVVKVNMEIISLKNEVITLDLETQSTIWKAYWSGNDNIFIKFPITQGEQVFHPEIIWEYLVEGRLILID